MSSDSGLYKRGTGGPDVCGSVGWASSNKVKPKGCQFDSWSGHMPGLQVWSLIEVPMRGNRTLMFLSLSSPPSKK